MYSTSRISEFFCGTSILLPPKVTCSRIILTKYSCFLLPEIVYLFIFLVLILYVLESEFLLTQQGLIYLPHHVPRVPSTNSTHKMLNKQLKRIQIINEYFIQEAETSTSCFCSAFSQVLLLNIIKSTQVGLCPQVYFWLLHVLGIVCQHTPEKRNAQEMRALMTPHRKEPRDRKQRESCNPGSRATTR